MKKFTFIVAFISLYLSLSAQDTLKLEEAINLGLEYNFDIKLAENQTRIAANNHSLGNAGFLPRADLNGSVGWTRENTNFEFATGEEQSRDGAKSRNINANAVANWVVFDGGRMFHTLEKLNQLKIAENLETARVIESIVADLTDAYYLVVLNQARREVLINNLRLSKQRIDISKAKYNIGKASKLEYLAAQVDYNEDTSALVNQVQALYEAKVNLNIIMGIDVSENYNVESAIEVNADLDEEKLKDDMYYNNTQLKISERQENIASLEIEEIRAENYPQLNLNLGYEINRVNAEAGFILSRRSMGFNYGASATWNIFNGLNLHRRKQNAEIQKQNAEIATSQLNQNLHAQFIKRYSEYASSLVLLQMEQENLAVAKENADIALDRYNIGNTNALELREAQQNLVDAESRLLNAAYTVKIAETELLRLSGQLVNFY